MKPLVDQTRVEADPAASLDADTAAGAPAAVPAVETQVPSSFALTAVGATRTEPPPDETQMEADPAVSLGTDAPVDAASKPAVKQVAETQVPSPPLSQPAMSPAKVPSSPFGIDLKYLARVDPILDAELGAYPDLQVCGILCS